MVHNRNSEDGLIADPRDGTVSLIKRIRNDIVSPPPVTKIAVMKPGLKVADISDEIKKWLFIMADDNITNIPVLKKGKLCGVLSEQTITQWARTNGKVDRKGLASSDQYLSDIENLLDPTTGSTTVQCEYVAPTMSVYDVQQLFEKSMNDQQRLMTVFVTSNGTAVGELEAIVTSWDLSRIST